MTVEDPVEYRLGENIVQVQVHDKAGLTFASALRSILRQDPDVVLIGEIRDQETAQIALQASLTGHLVLSTLHTNDAPNAVTRLVDMGMEPYKIASALRGVVAQRLMRRLCPACRVVATEPLPERVARYIPAGTPLFKAVGCPECAHDRVPGPVQHHRGAGDERRRSSAGSARAARRNRSREAARANGMRSLWESGLRHVLAGESTLDELLRVTDVPVEEAAGAGPGRRRRRPRPAPGRAEPPAPRAAAAPAPPARRQLVARFRPDGRWSGDPGAPPAVGPRPGRDGAAGGGRGAAPAGHEGPARAGGVHRRGGAGRRAGAGPGGPARARHHHARPQPARASTATACCSSSAPGRPRAAFPSWS